ncbi:MAG: tetratricopeptide repeat protein, partial [Planctomycetota bacterium]|nr:tetratricopeptide repeat protein [Planctomycetota bacterium]
RAGLEWFKTRSEAPPRTLEADVRRDQTRTVSPKDKQAVVAEFRWRLERLVRRAQGRGVKVLLSTVPCNLRQWRPEWSILEGLDEPGRRTWGEAFAAGQRAIESRDFAAAVSSLEQAARLAPAHAETQFLLGQAYEGLARWDDARRAYQLACDADAKPTRRLSAVNGAIRDVAAQTGALLVDMDKVFEEHSEHGLVGFNLIEDYVHPTREGHELIALYMWRAMEQGGWAGTAARPDQGAFDKVIARRHERALPPNPTWLRNQGVVLQNQGQLPAAMDKYRQCLALTPDDPVALLNLGSLLYEAGRSEEAVGFLERLAGLDGKNFVARNNLGNALMRLGKFTDAIRRYEEAPISGPPWRAQANWAMRPNISSTPCGSSRPARWRTMRTPWRCRRRANCPRRSTISSRRCGPGPVRPRSTSTSGRRCSGPGGSPTPAGISSRPRRSSQTTRGSASISAWRR